MIIWLLNPISAFFHQNDFFNFWKIGNLNAKMNWKFSTEQIVDRLVHQLSTLWPFLTSNPFPKMFLDFVFFTPKFNYTYVFTSILGPSEPRSNHYNFQHRTFHSFWTLFPLFKRLPSLTRTDVSEIRHFLRTNDAHGETQILFRDLPEFLNFCKTLRPSC